LGRSGVVKIQNSNEFSGRRCKLMDFDLKSKPILVSAVFGVLVLVLGAVYVAFRLVSSRYEGGIGEQPAATPSVKTEAGNPRLIITEPEKYSNEMGNAAGNSAPIVPTEVTIDSKGFAPSVVTVKAPYVVTFKNADTVKHSVEGVSGKWGSLKDLEPGESYSQQFDVAGTYEYSDPLNPSLKGKIIVE